MALTLPKTLLLLSVSWAVWALWIVSSQNGLFGQMTELGAPGSTFPGSDIIVRQTFTKIPFLDAVVSGTAIMFTPAVLGSRPDLSLVLMELLSQIAAAWTLFAIEAQRVGNAGYTVLTSITFLGVVMQSAGFAVVIPIYLYLHLRYSPTVQTTGLSVANPLHLLTLPISIWTSILLPSVLMSLPPPHYFAADHSTQQLWMASVYFFPFTLFVLQTILPAALSVLTGTLNTRSESDRAAFSLSGLRCCYGFGLVVAGFPHIAYLGVPLLAYSFPRLFNEEYLGLLQPGTVFLPVRPSGLLSMADGVAEFLKWEIILGLFPVLIWALTLRASSQRLWAYEWVTGALKVAGLVLLVGPAGAAVALVWERDEVVFARTAKRT